ncbi:DUF1501 domain-containing protein [Pikeienuella piscinae]|uniref:DUF1501 domain-containing protein n=1 Tax=Pikeienuella piscinae TaxID=2748098 RepID=A0A7L5BVL8_9RHOB|nr:DUF1501 domain-containing protein [Pikeienuella piscinae]QIE54547.1 DUF1501 domain-containing protein [Pikeienuella piscinae]
MIAIDRRAFLKSGLSLGCAAAALPLFTPLSLAAAPGENRLVVIILRGAMDGLGVFAPYGERDWARMRPTIGAAPGAGLIDLDGRFGMDARLAALHPLWAAEELAVVHAVSTPYRDKRSHFDGQDMLESGVQAGGAPRDGWLNRAVAHIDGARTEQALAVGREAMLLTSGDAPFRVWAPGERLALRNDERELLTRLYADDPLFAHAAALAEELSALDDGEADRRVAVYAAKRLAAEARIAAFSLGGWDTHAAQKPALKRPLKQLSDSLIALRDGLGPAWSRTLVIAMTEFGRTARENGNRGTDHGTGGAAILAGGAMRGGRVYGDWPGLGESDLYNGRDLTPTGDIRRYPAWALNALFGVPKSTLETAIFPALDMDTRPAFLA